MDATKKDYMVFLIIIGLFVFYFGDRIGEMYYCYSSEDIFEKLNYISDNLGILFTDIHFAISIRYIIWGLCSVGVFVLTVMYMTVYKKNYLSGIEHGSAKWGSYTDIKKLVDKNYDNNMLFTQTERMSLNTRQTLRNNNVLVIGGSGSGKTRFFLKPNLMQLHTSYVITDPKGTLIVEAGKLLADNGYKIRALNLVDFKKSMHYNPFVYLKEEKDILTLTDLIIKNCGGKNEKEDFWVKSERNLYCALIGYVFYELPPEEQNFSSVLTLLNKMEVREEDESFMNPVDIIFKELEAEDPEHFALLQYKKFKMGAGKTAKSILISCGVRLAAFDIKQVRDLVAYDEMALDLIGEEKTAVFIIIDDTSSTFNFIAGMFYTQLFSTLCHKADTEHNGRLPVHVRCLLDEFANIGQIPDFEKLIATIRSREISAAVILQNQAQLEALYDKNAGTIIGNCDTTLFLGSGEEKTLETFSKRVGKTTIDHKGTSTQKGQYGSFTLNDQILGRELITADEVGRLPDDECMLFIRGLRPFKSKKFDITKHKRYKYLSDADPQNAFDITEYNQSLMKTENESNSIVDDFSADVLGEN